MIVKYAHHEGEEVKTSPCQGCFPNEAEKGKALCDECQEEAEIMRADFIKYEMCAGGCRPMCEHDPAL